MKTLITYLLLVIGITTNAQRAEDLHAKTEEINKELTNWRANVELKMYELIKNQQALQNELSNALKKIESQSNNITQLKINALQDSLKIDRLSKKLDYTQSFVKDSVAFISINAEPIDTNLLADVSNINKAWADNGDKSYTYNHTVDNYQYLTFNFKENLKPQTTYIISFSVQLEDTSREALINFWFYDEAGNTRLTDTYYSEGKHTLTVKFEAEKYKVGIRARNNNGGSFTISNLKIEAQ